MLEKEMFWKDLSPVMSGGMMLLAWLLVRKYSEVNKCFAR